MLDSIGRRLTAGFATVGAVLFLAVSVSIWQTNEVSSIANRLQNLRSPTSETSLKMLNGINHSLAALRGYILLEDDRFKEERRKAWSDEISPSLEKMSMLSQHWTNSENQARLGKIRSKLSQFQEYQQEIEDIVGTSANRPDLRLVNSKIDPVGLRMMEQITTLIDLEKRRPASNKNKTLLSHMADFRGSLGAIQASLLAYLLTEKAHHKEAFANHQVKNDASFVALERSVSTMTLEQRPNFRVLTQAYAEFLPLQKELVQLRDREDYDIGNHWLRTKAAPIAFEIKDIVEGMNSNQGLLMQNDFDALASTIERMTWIEYALLIFGILGAIVVSILTVRSFVRSVHEAQESADAIAGGNLTTVVQVSGAKELREMGASIETMRVALLAVRDEQAGLLAVQEAHGRLAALLQEPGDITVLSNRVITFLGEFTNSQVGAVYLRAEDAAEELLLTGTYAFPRRKHLVTRIAPGEGLVSQAALEKQSILISDVPPDYIKVSSSLGESAPRNLLVVPILRRERVMGVLELGSFEKYSDSVIETVESMATSIGIALEVTQEAEKTQKLLEMTQQQSEVLQRQQEELQTQNEELQEQTAALKSSEEQLQAQSEELRTSNEELQEKGDVLVKQKLEIEQNSQRVERAKEEVEAKARELEQASKYKSEFLANMSHELRTPLNSLLILADSLTKNKTGNLTPDQVEKAQVIQSGGKDLLTLINDILDLSKVEAGKLDVQIETLTLVDILGQLRRQFTPIAENKGLALHVEVEADAPESIRTDGQRIQQILRNLGSNALKFTERGSVSIRVHRPDPTVRFGNTELSVDTAVAFSVTDTGIGIPADKQRSIFGAFQQADGSTSRRFGGTGLGLAISRELANLLGGEIALQSQEGQGSTFTLYLPITGSRVAGDDEGESNQDTRARLETELHQSPIEALTHDVVDEPDKEFIPDDRRNLGEHDRTVLIIEDDAAFAQILIDLSREQGFKCLTAGDGRTGLKMARRYIPSAIMLDIGLPTLDGLTVLDALKRHLSTRHIPVHVVSAYDEQSAARQKGALGYLQKPPSPESLEQMFQKFESVLQSRIKELLIVEDSPHGCDAMEALLAREDTHMTFATCGKEAYRQLTEHTFDCMVLDLGLPDMTGFELLEQLQQDPSITLPPVVVYTGQELTKEEYDQLSQYAKSVVIKGASSQERLLDDTTLFLHSVESTLPERQRHIIQRLYEPGEALQGRKVLVVDDDMRNTFALSTSLQECGCTVVMAADGQLALDALDREPEIDIVLMDVMMPVMDGVETIERIRVRHDYADVPIIALTALTGEDDRDKALGAGANDFLTKPVDMEQLIALMNLWLQQCSTPR